MSGDGVMLRIFSRWVDYKADPSIDRELSPVPPKSVFDERITKILRSYYGGSLSERELFDKFKSETFSEDDVSRFDEERFNEDDFLILGWRLVEKYFKVNITSRISIREFLVDWLKVTGRKYLVKIKDFSYQSAFADGNLLCQILNYFTSSRFMGEHEIEEASKSGNLVGVVITRAHDELSLPLLIPPEEWVKTRETRSILCYLIEVMMRFSKANRKIVNLLVKRHLAKRKSRAAQGYSKQGGEGSSEKGKVPSKRPRLGDPSNSAMRSSTLNVLSAIKQFEEKKKESRVKKPQRSGLRKGSSSHLEKELLALKKSLAEKDLEIESLRHENSERKNELESRMDNLRKEYETRIEEMKKDFEAKIESMGREQRREMESIADKNKLKTDSLAMYKKLNEELQRENESLKRQLADDRSGDGESDADRDTFRDSYFELSKNLSEFISGFLDSHTKSKEAQRVLRERVETLEGKLREAAKEREKSRSKHFLEVVELREEIARLSVSNTKKAIELKNLQRKFEMQVRMLKDRNQKLEAELFLEREKYQRYQTQNSLSMTKMNETIQNSKKDIAKLRKDLETLLAPRTKKERKVVERIKNEIMSITMVTGMKMEEIEAVMKQVDINSLENKVILLEKALEAKEGEVDHLTKQVLEFRSEEVANREKIKVLERKLLVLKKKLLRAKNRHDGLFERISAAQIGQLKAELEERDRRIAELTNREKVSVETESLVERLREVLSGVEPEVEKIQAFVNLYQIIVDLKEEIFRLQLDCKAIDASERVEKVVSELGKEFDFLDSTLW